MIRNILFFLGAIFVGSSASANFDECVPNGFDDNQDRGQQCVTLCKNKQYLDSVGSGRSDRCVTENNPAGAYCTCTNA